jgi:hypothetical protein
MNEQRNEETIREIVEVGKVTIETAYYERGSLLGRGGFSHCYNVRKFHGYSKDYLGEEAVLKKLSSSK